MADTLMVQKLHMLSVISHTRTGAGNGTRTRDPELGRLALYQLSYSRENGGEGRIRTFEGIAGRFTVCSLWPLGNLSSSPEPTVFLLPPPIHRAIAIPPV